MEKGAKLSKIVNVLSKTLDCSTDDFQEKLAAACSLFLQLAVEGQCVKSSLMEAVSKNYDLTVEFLEKIKEIKQ